MSQYESPTRHMQYRSIFQIKSTSTEFKHEDTAQRRKGTVSAWRSQSGTCGGRDGRSSYPDSKSEKKMIEKKSSFPFYTLLIILQQFHNWFGAFSCWAAFSRAFPHTTRDNERFES